MGLMECIVPLMIPRSPQELLFIVRLEFRRMSSLLKLFRLETGGAKRLFELEWGGPCP